MSQSRRHQWLMTADIAIVLAAISLVVTTQTTAKESELKRHFGEQQFAPEGGFVFRPGQAFGNLAWEHPELVATVIDDTTIPTRWFNERFEEIESATKPGRYYAYGEAPTPVGTRLRRAMTCCCVESDLNLKKLASEVVIERLTGAAVQQVDTDYVQKEVDDLTRSWRTTEEGAVELAALLDTDRPVGSARPGQYQMENATEHVKLKRKLMGLDHKPLVTVAPKRLQGAPAPILHNATQEQTGITAEQIREVENKLDAWYAASQEPTAVVIARNGLIVLAKGYGTLDGKKVTVDTPMRLDSAMKPLIGLQLATYVDRGVLQLDERIGNHLPDFASPDDRNLTFRAGHVHATGILFPWELAFRRLFYFHTWQESLIAHCPREWAPGTKYRYGVVGVILSVRALELLRGRNYWDAMERDLFAPLGIRNILPGGTGFSAESMARIGVLLDNRGKYGQWEVISDKTHAAILPTSLQPYFPELDRRYGIGLQDASQHLGPGSYGHGGGGGTLLAVNPQKHLVFAMVRNSQGKDFKKHRSEVATLLKTWLEE